MSEQEIQFIEQAIDKVSATIIGLTSQKTELEERIRELRNMQSVLTKLLPTEERINRLFS